MSASADGRRSLGTLGMLRVKLMFVRVLEKALARPDSARTPA